MSSAYYVPAEKNENGLVEKYMHRFVTNGGNLLSRMRINSKTLDVRASFELSINSYSNSLLFLSYMDLRGKLYSIA